MKEALKHTLHQEISHEAENNYVQDSGKAEVMAYAEKRNTENKMAFKAIAAAHIAKPELRKSPLGARIKAAEGEIFSSVDPSQRIVETTNRGGYAYEYTADSAIKEAKKEREAADDAAKLAGEQYDKENGVVSLVQNPEEAYYMAHAANRNEVNALEFEHLASKQEEFTKYDLRLGVDISPTEAGSFNFDHRNPQGRFVKSKINGNYGYTPDAAREEAQKERAAANEAADKAGEQFRQLNEI